MKNIQLQLAVLLEVRDIMNSNNYDVKFDDLYGRVCEAINAAEDEESTVLVKAELICVFSSFGQWVNYASSWLRHIDLNNDTLICLDVNGNECNIGKQFHYAKDHNLFPVSAYVLTKNDER